MQMTATHKNKTCTHTHADKMHAQTRTHRHTRTRTHTADPYLSRGFGCRSLQPARCCGCPAGWGSRSASTHRCDTDHPAAPRTSLKPPPEGRLYIRCCPLSPRARKTHTHFLVEGAGRTSGRVHTTPIHVPDATCVGPRRELGTAMFSTPEYSPSWTRVRVCTRQYPLT